MWERYYIKDEPFKIGMIEGDVVKYYEVQPYDFDELDQVKQRKLELIKEKKASV